MLLSNLETVSGSPSYTLESYIAICKQHFSERHPDEQPYIFDEKDATTTKASSRYSSVWRQVTCHMTVFNDQHTETANAYRTSYGKCTPCLGYRPITFLTSQLTRSSELSIRAFVNLASHFMGGSARMAKSSSPSLLGCRSCYCNY
jgi:hypothetical protein